MPRVRGDGFAVRRARDDDGPAMAAVFGAARAGMTYLPALHSAEEDVAFFTERVLPQSAVEVAEDAGGGVVAFCAVREGWVDHLYVSPDRQGCGIGTTLMGRAMAQNPVGLNLWVFEENHRARSLYGRLGFVEVERTDGSGNEEKQPDVRMWWCGPTIVD